MQHYIYTALFWRWRFSCLMTKHAWVCLWSLLLLIFFVGRWVTNHFRIDNDLYFLTPLREDSDGNVIIAVQIIAQPPDQEDLLILEEALELALENGCTNCEDLRTIAENSDSLITDTTPNSKKQLCDIYNIFVFFDFFM